MMGRVRIWPKLGGSLLVLVGCRPPNPEWEGPADGATSANGSTTVVDTTGPPNSSMPADSATTVTTEGQDCNNDAQCPDGWLCGPMGCQQGGDGDPCDAGADCQAPTSICGPEGTCQDGSADDPCNENGDCMDPTGVCGPDGGCQSGEVGDPCTAPNHCAGGLTCVDGFCA
jgi:hypothetical protein